MKRKTLQRFVTNTLRVLGIYFLLCPGCSSNTKLDEQTKATNGMQEHTAKNVSMTTLQKSSTGEFFDPADISPAHKARAAIGFLLWSGVPVLRDDSEYFFPEETLQTGEYLLWVLAANNRPIEVLPGVDTVSLQNLDQIVVAMAKKKQWISESAKAEDPISFSKAKEITEMLFGPFRISSFANSSSLRREEGAILLTTAIEPSLLTAFTPERAKAGVLIPTGAFWHSVWDQILEEQRVDTKEISKRKMSGKHRGVTIASLKPPEQGYGEPSFQKSIHYVKTLESDSLALVPYARILRYDIPTLIYGTGAGYPKPALKKAIVVAKQEGMRVLLKPHLWMATRPENKGQWTGTTDFSPGGWQDWLSRYRAMVLDYALLAERTDVDVFVIGTELKSVSKKHSEFLTTLIEEVRTVFHGEVTYAANHDEFQYISFWDKLDYIGIDAYFALSPKKSPSVKDNEEAWQGPKAQIERVVEAVKKPVLFLEAGYKARPYPTKAPWEWRSKEPEDQKVQEDAYRALFATFWKEPWFQGIYIWKYFSDLQSKSKEAEAEQFLPYQKRAENVLKEYFQIENTP